MEPLLRGSTFCGHHWEITVRRSIATAVFLLVGLVAPTLADVQILASPGGNVVPFLNLFENSQALRRTGHNRWTLLFCLHSRAERNSSQPYLCDFEGRSGLPCAPIDRSRWAGVRCLGREAPYRRDLSGGNPRLDRATWRACGQTHILARPGVGRYASGEGHGGWRIRTLDQAAFAARLCARQFQGRSSAIRLAG